MKFKEFIKNINAFAKDHPETLNMQVVYSCDEEGNKFNPVFCSPSKGIYYNEGDFIDFENYDEYERQESETNAVCIN
jgi:hypothetical protein